jgi:CRP/FNR family transcriptional regulator, anaerobic regulatory protein
MTSRSTSSETSGCGNGTVPPSEIAADAVNLDEARAAKLGEKTDLAAALLQSSPESLAATGEQLSVPVVSKLSDELTLGRRTVNEVFHSSSPRALESGVPLAAASGPSEGIYRLHAGWACQFRDWSTDRRIIVDVYLPGDVIGLDTILRTRRPEQVLTLTSGTIEMIPVQDVLTKVFADRLAALYITWLMCKRQQRVERYLAAVSSLDARSRLAMMMLDFYTRLRRRRLLTGLVYNLPLTQIQIGNYLGLTVVHVNRVLRALRDEQIVNLEKHCVTILDLARLTGLARNGAMASPSAYIAERASHEVANL